MRIRNFSGSKELIENTELVIKEPEKNIGNWHNVFGNNNPICLEIGMGKGNFLLGMALENTNINYIGVERYDTIVARALQKIEPLEIGNLKIIKVDAISLANIFDKEIDTIYLNFSDPWPKSKHEKRRLTSKIFLNIYDKLFKEKMTIIQKTDNKDLYNYSLESLSEYGYDIIETNTDLENSDIPNIKTEYEEKFIKRGSKINYLKAVKNKL